MIRFVILPHSVTCKRDKCNYTDIFWDLNITFNRYFVCLKKNQSIASALSFNLKLFQTKVDIKSVIRDYSLRNYVVNI